MSKLSFKIALPVVLCGFFAIVILIAINLENLNPAFYVIFLLLAVFVFFFGFATGQNYSSPVKKLLKKAKDLSEGDLDARVYIETKDELEELAKFFNLIAENMKEKEIQERNAEQSVEMKVRAKTHELEEMIEALEQKVKNRTIEMERLAKESESLNKQSKQKESEITGLKKEIEELKNQNA